MRREEESFASSFLFFSFFLFFFLSFYLRNYLTFPSGIGKERGRRKGGDQRNRCRNFQESWDEEETSWCKEKKEKKKGKERKAYK